MKLVYDTYAGLNDSPHRREGCVTRQITADWSQRLATKVEETIANFQRGCHYFVIAPWSADDNETKMMTEAVVVDFLKFLNFAI